MSARREDRTLSGLGNAPSATRARAPSWPIGAPAASAQKAGGTSSSTPTVQVPATLIQNTKLPDTQESEGAIQMYNILPGITYFTYKGTYMKLYKLNWSDPKNLKLILQSEGEQYIGIVTRNPLTVLFEGETNTKNLRSHHLSSKHSGNSQVSY